MNQKLCLSTAFRQIPLVLLAIAATLVSGCQADHGENIIVDGTEIYFDGTNTTKADAERLGAALQKTEFTDGNRKSVKLIKDGDNWEVHMVMQDEHLSGTSLDSTFKLMCLELSCEFDGAAFTIHACDDKLVSKKSFTGLTGKKKKVGASDFYYADLNDQQLKQTEAALVTLGFDKMESTLHLSKGAAGRDFRMVCQPQFFQDEALVADAKNWIGEFSKVFDGETVAIHLCDEHLEIKNTIK